MTETCYWGICFFALDPGAPKFFGFAEFVAGLALMILAWTIADVRYRFRVSAAPIPLLETTYGVVAAIGVLTLLTDLWRAQKWLVPHLQNSWITPASWQAILGFSFFATFLVWTWYAFIRPPLFGARNAERYSRAVANHILKGITSELTVIADEIALSASTIIQHAPDHRAFRDKQPKYREVEKYAVSVLGMMGDRRFCRAVVESSPRTVLEIFKEMGRSKKYGVPVQTFSKNVVKAALIYKDSFLYQETNWHETGLLGHEKPLTQAMFGNHELVEAVRTLLDPPSRGMDAEQLAAYARAVLLTLRSSVAAPGSPFPSAIYRALTSLQGTILDVYKLDGVEEIWATETMRRLDVVVGFIVDALRALGTDDVFDAERQKRRRRDGVPSDLYDRLAEMIFETIALASRVRRPAWTCWDVQRNSVWARFFSTDGDFKTPAIRLVQFKVRRMIYDEICEMDKYQNFRAARLLGLCLTVMGFNKASNPFDRATRALQKAVLSWTAKNYATMHSEQPQLAEACLTASFSSTNVRNVWRGRNFSVGFHVCQAATTLK